MSIRDSKNVGFAGKHGKRHAMRAHMPQAVSDCLNPHSLGTMISAFGYIDHVAKKSTCLINYQKSLDRFKCF